MTTEPGVIPRKIKTLDYAKLPKYMQHLLMAIAKRMKNLVSSLEKDKRAVTELID